MTTSTDIHYHYRACHLCEATCGLEITVKDKKILSIKGNKEDPLSHGYFCPKALALKEVQNDPDRLKTPVKRVGSDWKTISWDEAFDTVVEQFVMIRENHGPNSIGIYLGNPCVHNYGMMTHAGHFLGLLKTRNRFSATSLDQLPHHLVGYWMYGHQMMVPIPDIDRTDYFLIIGGNPVVSNGSMMTVPNIKKRIKALKARGGKLVVIDPRRTETAKSASEHIFIRPGSDAVFLLALLNILFGKTQGKVHHLDNITVGLDQVKEQIRRFTPEIAETVCGIDVNTIRRLGAELFSSRKAVCYGRMGVSVQSYGTLCQWIIQLINIVIGSLDKEGGALFSSPAFDTIAGPASRPGHYDQWQSRVGDLPEFGGELPSVAMAEEMLTAGEGQIKAMFTAAANPVLTASNGTQLEKAFSSLDFMVSLDPYINETTRFADIILPPTTALEHDHYDIAFNALSVRNTARYNQPLFEKPEGSRHDWEIYTELGKRLADKLGVKSKPEMTPEQMLDFSLQTGPYGAHAGHALKLSLESLKKEKNGIDFGPLKPSLPERLATNDKKIQCAPALLIKDLDRVEQELMKTPTDPHRFLLIGRRHLFDANSWLHNVKRLVKGKDRCQLYIHPVDLEEHDLKDGDRVTVSSGTGSVKVALKVTDEIIPGVVCLPHGWGHHRNGIKLSVAREHAGVSFNDLTDDKAFDPISGNAVLNAISVKITKG
ncbi:molybdopterin-dependent oxidoreductase [bacterium]|nr:molybdopterin-dependent oxidoreductase [bacterium]